MSASRPVGTGSIPGIPAPAIPGLSPFTCHFHLSPWLCPPTAGCSPPSMSSIVPCLSLSCFTFHLGFVRPLQDVALHQCLPLSFVAFLLHFSPRLCPSTAGCSPPSMSSIVLSVAFLFQVVPSFLVMSSFHLLLGRPLVSSLSLVVTLCSVWSTYCPSFLLRCPAHLHFCLRVYTTTPVIFVLFLISEHGILSYSFRPSIFLSIAL